MAPIPGYPDSEPVELLPEIWTTVCHDVHTVTIVLESEMPSASGDTTACGSPVPSAVQLPGTPRASSSSSAPPPRPAPQPRAGPFSLFWSGPAATRPVQSQSQQSVLEAIVISFPAFFPAPPAPFTVREPGLLDQKVSRLFELIDPRFGFSASNSTLNFGDLPLNNGRTFSDYGIASGDTVQLNREMMIAKPVIYLYPPSSLPDISVQLALTPAWRFYAVHPPPRTTIPPGEPHTAQSLTWSVTAEPNGTLVDNTSGMEVSYLYWEAKTNSQLMTPGSSRATTPVANTETFSPARPIVDPGDSVLLPISKVPSYLDAALKALALHTEARTSFITLRILSLFPVREGGKHQKTDIDLLGRYWLPNLLKHEYIALRFIAQDAYERAAELHIVPAPDIVTRVFMLFRGVAAGDLGLWEAASARAEGTSGDGPTSWVDIVGVDATRAADSRLFRVLEWGGMEVV
ncbi:hypothetical protein EI94DRAFT_614301 [Lactarius quietus]|nr:hypothetical protein EI94DRAFT_614301 [Lactarius quietus]